VEDIDEESEKERLGLFWGVGVNYIDGLLVAGFFISPSLRILSY
jgi:hypothetical protein